MPRHFSRAWGGSVDLGLDGRIAIVNGASQGIGFAIARTLAEEGARVVATARREPALKEAVHGLADETGGEVIAVQGDVRRAEDCLRIVDETVGRFGGVDILVNNDGAPPLGAFTDFDDHVFTCPAHTCPVFRLSSGAVVL